MPASLKPHLLFYSGLLLTAWMALCLSLDTFWVSGGWVPPEGCRLPLLWEQHQDSWAATVGKLQGSQCPEQSFPTLTILTGIASLLSR